MSDEARVLIAEGLLKIGEKLSIDDETRSEFSNMHYDLCCDKISVDDFIARLDVEARTFGVTDFYHQFLSRVLPSKERT